MSLPVDPLCDFPLLTIPTEDHVCKRIEATVEGDSGEFYGVVCKASNVPDGYGVFKVG